MFTYLTFKMENSMGLPVSVSLRNDHGIVHYGVGFIASDDAPKTEQTLSSFNSAKLLQKIDQLGLVQLLPKYEALGLNEGGDYWKLHVEHLAGQINLSGARDSHAVIVPMLQDFAEILDDALYVTQYIRATRLDRLDIEFEFNEWDPEMRDNAEEYNALLHSEIVVLDRQTNTASYSKRFPARCAQCELECRFDEEIRDLLDQAEILFTEPAFFEDIYDEHDHSPRLLFTFLYHDGTMRRVQRQLSTLGLRDQIYFELLDVINNNLLSLLFKQSLFDKRMVLPVERRKHIPFFVMYREEQPQSDDEPEVS